MPSNDNRSWIQRLLNRNDPNERKSWIRQVVSGRLYKLSDVTSGGSIDDIKSVIDSMRALANDSQVSTALSYYATDSTTTNTAGQIIWATSKEDGPKELGDIINSLFKRWEVDSYARDHILELATIGNLYLPTTMLDKSDSSKLTKNRIAIDNNTVPDEDFDIIASTKVAPEDVVHVYKGSNPVGYVYQSDDGVKDGILCPESSIIHFSLGGLLGDYTIDLNDENGETETYDIKFARPLLLSAIQPTQILNLLEDALVLASLIRTVKFVNVECGDSEEAEVEAILQDIKMSIEQQMSFDTNTGNVESYLNPQSPNNLIYLPRIKEQDAISITDLNMAEATEEDTKLLDYYQDKKLSVLGVPKEAMNFSSNEGLGGAGSVLSQRSAIYANILQRIKTAYISGWRSALNTYFTERGMSGFVDKFDLHMAEIVTTQSTVTFEKRDAAISQANSIVQLLKDVGDTDKDDYKAAITEILTEVLPITGSKVSDWDVSLEEEEGPEGGGMNEF